MKRWWYCSHCKVQSWTCHSDDSKIVHIPCGLEMLEICTPIENCKFTNEIKLSNRPKEKPMRINCAWCDAHPEHKNSCPYRPKEEKSVNPRYFACTSCKVQTEIADVEDQEVFHSDCGKEMLEISRKLSYGAYPFTSRWHIKKKEEPVNFEVGDKVSVVGTVGQLWRYPYSGQSMADVKFDGEQNVACIPVSMLTLVERPVKFEKGKIYRRKDRPTNGSQYMYLGELKFYSYLTNEVLVKQPTSEWLKILIPVEES